VEFKTELMQTEEEVHLNGVLEKEENFKIMEFCLSTLTDDQKETIRLFYLEGKCYNEITEQTGREWNQVRSLIQNGRRNLKICMEKQATVQAS
jgi:RNA polymerase sigma factor (sigma-70 family)